MINRRVLLLDVGNTLVKEIPAATGPMVDWPELETIDGALETLEQLKGEYFTAVATNAADSTEEQIWQALRRVGLDDLIERVYCYRSIGHKKPAAAFFRYVLDDLQVLPENVVMVGDSFENDVQGALQSGLKAAWLTQTAQAGEGMPGCCTIHSLAGLPAALKTLFA